MKALRWLVAWRVPVGVVLVLLVVLMLALKGDVWPFTASPPPVTPDQKDASAWQYFLGDRTTVGIVRLSIVLLGVYVVASVPALILSARWLKGFGSSGLTADDAAQANDVVKTLKRQLRETEKAVTAMTSERDEWRRIVEDATHP